MVKDEAIRATAQRPLFTDVGAIELAPWRRPANFMAGAGTSGPIPGNCLAHALQEVLRGHGVANPIRHVTWPVGVVFEVDRYLRPWLLAPGEQWFDRPRFFHGLRARWRMAQDLAGLHALGVDIVASGRVPVLRSYEWHLPWMRRSGLPVLNPHVLVAVEWGADQVVLIDRWVRDESGRVEDITMRLEDLGASLNRGIAVLDYSMHPDSRAGGTAAILSESNRYLRGVTGPTPMSSEYGIRAIRLLAELASPEYYPSIDSRMLRLWLRAHMPDNIETYIVSSRRIFKAYVAAEPIDGAREIIQALEHTCEQWQRVAGELAASDRTDDRPWDVEWVPLIEAELELAATLQQAAGSH